MQVKGRRRNGRLWVRSTISLSGRYGRGEKTFRSCPVRCVATFHHFYIHVHGPDIGKYLEVGPSGRKGRYSLEVCWPALCVRHSLTLLLLGRITHAYSCSPWCPTSEEVIEDLSHNFAIELSSSIFHIIYHCIYIPSVVYFHILLFSISIWSSCSWDRMDALRITVVALWSTK